MAVRIAASGARVTDFGTYHRLRPRLETGDVVLFSGKSGISEAVKALTRSAYSHAGMVVRIPEVDLVCVWESTTLSNVPDYFTGRGTRGVQVVPLSERLRLYRGEVSVRMLQAPRPPAVRETVGRLRQEWQGRPYERHPLELLRAAYDGPGGANRTANILSFFCSELVAEVYQRCGWLPADPPSNEYVPADFTPERGTVERALTAGAALLAPIRLR